MPNTKPINIDQHSVELVRAAASFRSRLRADWKRHAARVIASKGGSLESQIQKAEAYAAAEALINPKTAKVETMSSIDGQGTISTVTVQETPAPADSSTDPEITVRETTTAQTPLAPAAASPPPSTPSGGPSATPIPVPFRDPAWESTELAYHTLAVASLNALARSYNLMAPDLAKKPYFSLARELRACFADVAPRLPAEIERRASAPPARVAAVGGHGEGGVLERFGGGGKSARVWDERRPGYGFREFWRDLWGR